MRMGRQNKKRRSSPNKRVAATTINPNPPKFSSPTLIVGQVSSNVISSILTPLLTDLAVGSVEEYANELLVYEQLVVEQRLASADGLSSSSSSHDDDDNDVKVEVEDGEEVELDLDGNILSNSNNNNADNAPTSPTNLLPSPPSTYRLFTTQSDIDNLSTLLTETSSHFTHPQNTYKVHANAAKFERLLDEKYGKFRPFIESHPKIELFIKNISRKYVRGAFSPISNKPLPMNKTTSIMILFMMHRNNVRLDALILVATFCLVGLQPWALVLLVALGKIEMDRRKNKKVYGIPSSSKLIVCEPYYDRGSSAQDDDNNDEEEEKEEDENVEIIMERTKKYNILTQPVGTKYNPADLSIRDEEHNVLLLGSGVETLYTAALLARAGRKVCVLSTNSDDVSECVIMEKQTSEGGKFAKVPFDVKGMNIAHLSKQQVLLAPALVTSTDTQGGIRFARVGGSNDGYAHSILSVPGLGTDNVNAESIPVVINAVGGPTSLAEYCSTCLGDGYPGTDLDGNDNGNSTSLGYIKACRQINAGGGEYFLSKLFPAKNQKSSSESNVYQQATIRPASAFLNKCLPLNAHVRCLMAAIGMANENLSPDHTSMAAHVTHLSAMLSEEGMAYPIGGPRALCHALTSVIEQCGGRVVSGVTLQELLFDKLPEVEEKKKKATTKTSTSSSEDETSTTTDLSGPKPRCKGVQLQNGCEITVSETNGAVISTMGLIPTFLHLLPPDIRTAHGVPPGLPAVTERRPLMKILVGLNGMKDELDLTGADWYRLPNATLPRDEMDPVTGQVKPGTIGIDDSDSGDAAGGIEGSEEDGLITESTASAVGQSPGRGKRSKAPAPTPGGSSTSTKKPPRSKFIPGSSWMKVSFPSAKDPSWVDRHGSISTCVVTIEADDDFVQMFDTKPKIYSVKNKGGSSSDMERMSDKVLKDLITTFPQLEGKIECVQVCGPFRSGLIQDPARFAIKGNRPEMPYPGLFIGGADLTVADSTSGALVGGWLAANAVMGYSFIDHLYLKKNITSDLQQFLEEPSLATVRNGVVVEDVAVPFTEKLVKKDGEEDDVGETNAAESTKEE